MGRNLLLNLNGNKTGELKKFLDNFNGEPRIAWYPSAGTDFRALLYLHPSFSKLIPASELETRSPDLFLFTDYYPWQSSTFLDSKTIYSDNKTKITIEHIEELPRLNLPLQKELVDFPEGSSATNKAVFLKLNIESNILGNFSFPVVYAFAENVAFYCEKLIPNEAKISHIMHVRYGGGCGGGGKATGVWLLNVLKKLNCEVFITDGHYAWQTGDKFALEFYPAIPKKNDVQLVPIRVISGHKWSDHGDVSWNFVS